MISIINTEELIKIIYSNLNKFLEVRLMLSNSLFATHFIFAKSRNYFYDEGIDGEERKVSKIEFLENYNNCNWIVDQII